MLLKLYNENPNPGRIRQVVETLRNGGIIIYPTDTVYGLGCDITNTKALERIARIKGVKLEKSNFSFICHDLSNLSDYVKQISTSTFKLSALCISKRPPPKRFPPEKIPDPIVFHIKPQAFSSGHWHNLC